MKKLIMAFFVSTLPIFAFSQQPSDPPITGNVPVICVNLEDFVSAIEEFNEVPYITAMSSRDIGDETVKMSSMVIFYNEKTKTFTIAEKIGNYYCVIALGENMELYFQKNSIKIKM